MLQAGLCNYVVLSYGHNAFSSDSMRRMLFERNADDAVFGHFGAVAGYALAARRAMNIFRTGPETWKHIAAGQRKWANLNLAATMYDCPMTFEDYYNARWIVEPFRLFDTCLMTDGGRAVIITSAERARDLRHPPVLIMGVGQHNPSYDVHQGTHLAGPTGAKKAGERALRMAGITLNDIDACEIYDCFTYTVEITLQDYGFFGPGEGEDWLKNRTIEPGGRMPVNTSGGQLSEGYYMGLTPLSEAAMQLMGRCGERQLGSVTNTKSPEIILCSDNGGILQTHSCIVLRRSRMGEYNKPLPNINRDSKEFWVGCREHELRFQKCKICGHVRWPASIICPMCYSNETKWIVARGKGKIYTFVVYHVAYHPGFANDLPYVVADVELEEGPRLLTNIVGCPPDEVKCEMLVEVTWEDITEEFSLPKFKPYC